MKKEYKKLSQTAIVGSLLCLSMACGGGSVGEVILEEPSLIDENLAFEKGNSEGSFQVFQKEVFEGKIFDYVKYAVTLIPEHFKSETGPFKDASEADNTPEDNQITNEGALLGRVLFYDKNLSLNKKTSCSSCHQQKNGFSDKDRFSKGFAGERTERHSPGLTQARYYEPGKYFWDERAETLEAQVLMPIQNEVEMGMTLEGLVERLEKTDYYSSLFTQAFGDGVISSERISLALAQFIRSMVSYQSPFDKAFDASGLPQFEENLSDEENLGLDLFLGKASVNGEGINCSICHGTTAIVSSRVANIGLPNNTDIGAGDSKFKAPSLRNVAVRKNLMHDGRFESIRDVIDHYSQNIEDDPNLNRFLKNENEEPLKPNYTSTEKDALIAFLKTLTDETFLKAPQFSNPFKKHKVPEGVQIPRNSRPLPRGQR